MPCGSNTDKHVYCFYDCTSSPVVHTFTPARQLPKQLASLMISQLTSATVCMHHRTGADYATLHVVDTMYIVLLHDGLNTVQTVPNH